MSKQKSESDSPLFVQRPLSVALRRAFSLGVERRSPSYAKTPGLDLVAAHGILGQTEDLSEERLLLFHTLKGGERNRGWTAPQLDQVRHVCFERNVTDVR
jgi:hypothetical protein